MEAFANCGLKAFVVNLVIATAAIASVETIGPFGINSAWLTTANGLPLNVGAVGTANPVAIGQVEPSRSADPTFDTDSTLYNSTVNPAGVFFLKQGPPVTFNAIANSLTEIGGVNGQHALERYNRLLCLERS